MDKPTSYGVLIFNESHQLLVAHVTGQNQWDIPKGGGDPGETPVVAALRELLEETGVALKAEQLTEVGRVQYTVRKNLHLFIARVDSSRLDITQCNCTSFFPHEKTGLPTKEVDAFRWMDRADVDTHCAKGMIMLLNRMFPRSFSAAPDTTGVAA